MTTEHVLSVVAMYEARLESEHVAEARMEERRTFGSLTRTELLGHALHLCTSVRTIAQDPSAIGKLHRHFASLQLCLSFANIFTLEELMMHNRPRE